MLAVDCHYLPGNDEKSYELEMLKNVYLCNGMIAGFQVFIGKRTQVLAQESWHNMYLTGIKIHLPI